jgi:hypothetical protein
VVLTFFAGGTVKRFGLVSLVAAALVAVPTGVAQAGVVTPQHDVVCTTSIGGARANGTTGVVVSGTVRCNASVDVAVTTIQLQIYEGGQWRLYGNSSSTASTAANINISDSAARKPGCWAYRGVITREAFHHNWGTTTKYGESASFCG